MSSRRAPRPSALSGHPAHQPTTDPSPTTLGTGPFPDTETTPVMNTTAPAPAVIPRPATPVTPASSATLETDPLPATGKMTVNVRRDLINEAKDAFWLARGEYRTFAAWVEDALLRQIAATKAVHGVDVIPGRPGPLPPGRPLS